MSNPFDDLETDDAEPSDATGESTTDAVDTVSTTNAGTTDAETVDDETTSTTTVSRESSDRTSSEETGDESTGTDAADSGPAFEYGEVRQKPLYARDATWTEFEKNVRTTITPALAEVDVVDEETREIHDAVLRLANAEPERVAELVLEARREP